MATFCYHAYAGKIDVRITGLSRGAGPDSGCMHAGFPEAVDSVYRSGIDRRPKRIYSTVFVHVSI